MRNAGANRVETLAALFRGCSSCRTRIRTDRSIGLRGNIRLGWLGNDALRRVNPQADLFGSGHCFSSEIGFGQQPAVIFTARIYPGIVDARHCN